jgi:hypothetical protein
MQSRNTIHQYPELQELTDYVFSASWDNKPLCSVHAAKRAGLGGGRFTIQPFKEGRESCDSFVLVDVAQLASHPDWAVQGLGPQAEGGVRYNTPAALHGGESLGNRLCALRVERLLRVKVQLNGSSNDLAMGALLALKVPNLIVGFQEYKPATQGEPIQVPSVLQRDSSYPSIQFAVPLCSILCMLVSHEAETMFLPCMKTM